ncbi:MAG: entericidin A/B family lipoprotein [Burkholderiales bacterium]|nr:entericidin A/B family lipoprotein [Burkholderiales bacterium]
MKSKSVWTLLAMVVAAVLMQGCNTMEGIGKDIGAAGDKIEDTAKKSK